MKKEDIEKAYLGKRVKINHLRGENNTYDGKEGEVRFVDDMCQLHGTWGGLAIIPDEDDFEIIG